MKISWSQALAKLDQAGEAFVIATLITTRGSTPRNSGSKMVIAKNAIYDTLGGGHLEYKIIKQANKMLLENKTQQDLKQFDLGIHLDQCCGGRTQVLFEAFEDSRVNIMIFGAGHVGQALQPLLASLPCRIRWVDSRNELLNGLPVTPNVEKLVSADPISQVEQMPSNSFYIVLTHKHQLDFELCTKILTRNDFSYLGLIGSHTKWRRFKKRLLRDGITQQQIDRVSCPIGLEKVVGKLPAEIAISIAAQVVSRYSELALPVTNKNQQRVKQNLIEELMP
ncbi:MAG: xanthine dehydrogenase accessory protein XdhC [Enterobacterales bacterium]|nr:xanthine dehydrogenase accessory protein XdhC [Enterobacterales bacterium]